MSNEINEVVVEEVPVEVTEIEEVTNEETHEEPAEEVLVDEEDKPLSSKKNYNARVRQVIEQREQALARALTAEQKLSELSTKPAPKAEVVVPTEFNKPKPEQHQFASIGDFTEALSDWKDEAREAGKIQVAKQQKQQELATKVTETWNTREVAVKAEVEDYDAVVNVDALHGISLTDAAHTTAREFLGESEFGPAVLYELLQNEELAKKFKDASPIVQVKMLTRIETTIEAKQPKTAVEEVINVGSNIKILPKLKSGAKAVTKTVDDALKIADPSERFAEYARLRHGGV